jgi:circadian clock protein KaiB
VKNKIELSLFVNGMNRKSNLILAKLIKFCDEKFEQDYKLNIYDVKKDPEIGLKSKILITPALLRNQPKPEIRIVGNLENIKKAMLNLNLFPG